jgi:hypothetical protein
MDTDYLTEDAYNVLNWNLVRSYEMKSKFYELKIILMRCHVEVTRTLRYIYQHSLP